ncbi:MAG: glycolate oxidase iron-sulfur subunit [Planctomycetota bacterium]|jgi:glycolate oxidase iron-sulfur subunit
MSTTPIKNQNDLIDYAGTLDCIHCGLCLETCPTYTLTGVETSSPRGRVHLMRAVAEEQIENDAEFRDEMEFCLVCRHCESVCPAGIRMGEMMSVTRDAMYQSSPRTVVERLARYIGFRLLLPSRTALRITSSLLRIGQKTGLIRFLVRNSPFAKNQLAALNALPTIPDANKRGLLPALIPASVSASQSQSPPQRAALFEGCVMPELYSEVNHATAQVITRLGVEVHTTKSSVCCGALHAHNGDLEEARDLARKLIVSYEKLGDKESADDFPIVVNSAGCSAHMKEYAHLFETDDPWHARATRISERVVDFSEYVHPLLENSKLKLHSTEQGPVTWDNPCHLCHGQGIRKQPLSILESVEFAKGGFVDLDDSESCCGSAGIYSALRPDDSTAILAPKLDALELSGAKLLVTANPGCQLQWQSGIANREMGVKVKHLAQVLADALPSD